VLADFHALNDKNSAAARTEETGNYGGKVLRTRNTISASGDENIGREVEGCEAWRSEGIAVWWTQMTRRRSHARL